MLQELQTLLDKIEKVIQNKERIQWFASKQATQDIFFIGWGLDYAVLLEGSLKLKEISYIHSEVHAAGRIEARDHQSDIGQNSGYRCGDTAGAL